MLLNDPSISLFILINLYASSGNAWFMCMAIVYVKTKEFRKVYLSVGLELERLERAKSAIYEETRDSACSLQFI